jgi:hypothetical protein
MVPSGAGGSNSQSRHQRDSSSEKLEDRIIKIPDLTPVDDVRILGFRKRLSAIW